VESKAEVHVQRPRSHSAVTLNSSVASGEAAFSAVPEESAHAHSDIRFDGGTTEREETQDKSSIAAVPNGGVPNPNPKPIKPKTSQGPQVRPKLFRNKTAPVSDEPIRLPITAHAKENGKEGRTTSIFQI